MILLISAKDWINDSKKLVQPKDYIVLDCTDCQETGITKFSNQITMDNFCIPSKLLSAMNKDLDEDMIDIDSAETLEKEFFRGEKFRTSVLATVSTYLRPENDINVFIVVRNKAYTFYRKRFVTEFCRIFPEIQPYIKIYNREKKGKILKQIEKDLPLSDRDILLNELVKEEKKMQEDMKPLTKKKKKGKKKDKKDKKGWGFTDKYKM